MAWDEKKATAARKLAREKHDLRAENIRTTARETVSRITAAISTGSSRLGDARIREIIPAAAWGAADVITGGLHSKFQNQKLEDKAADALGRPRKKR